MAIRKIYIGSVGPFLYDDADPIDDSDGDFAGENYRGLATDGQMLVEAPPTQDNEVIRQIDIDHRIVIPVSVVDITNPTELNSTPGTNGTIAIAYQIIGAATQDEYTIYAYDADGPVANPPTIVDAFGAANERWIAIGGKYNITIAEHGDLIGLADDDHLQYHNNVRGDARYYTEIELDAGQLDNRYYTETECDTNFSASGHTHDIISEGNSSVEVIDTGTGRVETTVDGSVCLKVQLAGTRSDVKLGLACSAGAWLDINSDILRLRTAKTPATAAAAGNAGDICWDANYVYVCVATNTWKRSALSTW